MNRVLPLVVIAVLLGGCAHLARKSGPLTLGAADSGKTVSLVVKQGVTVRLPSNPSTGYRWQTATEPDARFLIVVDSGYERPAENMPGASGQAWWKLRATGAGSTSFTLCYVRPWAPDVKAQQFTLNVTVK